MTLGFVLVKHYHTKYSNWDVTDTYYHIPTSSWWFEKDGWVHDDPFDPAKETHYLGPMGYWVFILMLIPIRPQAMKTQFQKDRMK